MTATVVNLDEARKNNETVDIAGDIGDIVCVDCSGEAKAADDGRADILDILDTEELDLGDHFCIICDRLAYHVWDSAAKNN